MKRQHTFLTKLLTCLSTSGWWFFFFNFFFFFVKYSAIFYRAKTKWNKNISSRFLLFFILFHLSRAGKLFILFRGLLMIPVRQIGVAAVACTEFKTYTLSLCTVCTHSWLLYTRRKVVRHLWVKSDGTRRHRVWRRGW
jgi:hypothetical protein